MYNFFKIKKFIKKFVIVYYSIVNTKNYIKNVGISNDKYFRKNITVSSRFSAKISFIELNLV